MSSTNIRVFLWATLALVLWFNYEAWVRDYGPSAVTAQPPAAGAPAAGAEGSSPSATGLGASIPQAAPKASPATTATAPTPAPSAGAQPEQPPVEAAEQAVGASADTVSVRTDVLDLEIALQGGELRRADLLAYPKEKDRPEDVVRLFNRDSPETLFVLQTGLTGPSQDAHPTHLATFSAPAGRFELASGANKLRVPLTWTDPQGVTVTKIFVFRRGSYRIDLEYEVANRSGSPWQGAAYAQFLRDDPPVERSMFDVESYAFRGPAIYDSEKYQKLDIEDEADGRLAVDVTGGWIAAMQHHFVAAVVPPADVQYRFTLQAQDREYLLSAAGPLRTVEPGAVGRYATRLFVGPKLQAQLEQTGPRLDLVADYGMLTFLASPLFWLLDQVHGLVGNWGWAIVIVTLLLKLVFYPLSEASGRSMARMKALAPRIKNLQETHKDDREKLGRAMMELYQREKINPVSGCLPMLVQIPVFLAFYWVLLESVEMRQAPFLGWIDDLSSRDPFFILPAIMAAAMFIQYKLNPAPPDPIQAKVFMIMPLAMSVMFAFFPAGLVLYWVTNTVLSIAQQWNINRRIEGAAKKS
jgi:YidC/Oxa1 family membrane protein insertase